MKWLSVFHFVKAWLPPNAHSKTVGEFICDGKDRMHSYVCKRKKWALLCSGQWQAEHRLCYDALSAKLCFGVFCVSQNGCGNIDVLLCNINANQTTTGQEGNVVNLRYEMFWNPHFGELMRFHFSWLHVEHWLGRLCERWSWSLEFHPLTLKCATTCFN